MKKVLLVLMLLTISSTVVNAGKLEVIKKIALWAKDKAGWIIGAGALAPELVSAAGYKDADYDSGSDDLKEAINDGKVTYSFTFCTAKNGDEVVVANDVKFCHDGSTPKDGITIDLSKLTKD